MLDPVRNYSRIIVMNRTAVKHKCHEPPAGGGPWGGRPRPEGPNPKEIRRPKSESAGQRVAAKRHKKLKREGIALPICAFCAFSRRFWSFAIASRISDFGLL